MQFAKIRKAFNICNTFLRLANAPSSRWHFLLREITSEPIERQQSTIAVIAEASQSTRYGTGSVAETAIRDLLTQTPRGFLAWLEKKRRKRQHKQKWTTKSFLAKLGKRLSKVVMVVVKKENDNSNDNTNNMKTKKTLLHHHHILIFIIFAVCVVHISYINELFYITHITRKTGTATI